MRYRLSISKHLNDHVERRYAAIVKLWFDTFLVPFDDDLGADFICKALKNQTTWMEEPFQMRFVHSSNIAMAIRASDGQVLLTIEVLTKGSR